MSPDTTIDTREQYWYRIVATKSGKTSNPSNVVYVHAGPLMVGFYGADVPFGWPNGGNPDMLKIKDDLLAKGFDVTMFNSLAWGTAYSHVIDSLDTNDDGQYDPTGYWTGNGETYHPADEQHLGDIPRSMRFFGYSWGGMSVLHLAGKINSNKDFEYHREIDMLYTIDPISIGRGAMPALPGNVQLFENWYQTIDTGSLLGLPIRGEEVSGTANNFCVNAELLTWIPLDPLHPERRYDAAHAAIVSYVSRVPPLPNAIDIVGLLGQGYLP